MPNTITRLLALGSLLAAATLASCDGAPSRTSARDAATKATCDRFAACNQIGTGLIYADRDTCDVQVRADWDGRWPAAACEGKINGDQLDICLAAIRITECGNIADAANTLINKCPQAKICGTAADSGA